MLKTTSNPQCPVLPQTRSIISSKLQKFLFGTFETKTKNAAQPKHLSFPIHLGETLKREHEIVHEMFIVHQLSVATRPRPWLTDIHGDPTHQHKVLGLTIC